MLFRSELIRATHGAHNAMLDLEELDEAVLDTIRADYGRLALQARLNVQQGMTDTAGNDDKP